MKQNNPSKEQRANRDVKNSLTRLALGMGKHVERTETRNANGEVIKTITTITPTKPNPEACKFLLDRYGAEDEKAKPKKRAKR